MSISSSVFGFSRKPQTRPVSSIRMMPNARAASRVTGIAAIVTSAPDCCVRLEHVAVVHAVQLVAGQDQHVFHAGLFDVADVLPHGVGRALIPVGPGIRRLLGGQHFDEAAGEVVEAVGPANVAVQAHREELREHVDPVEPAVDAVGQRDVDQPVLGRQRHRRLRADFRERIQAVNRVRRRAPESSRCSLLHVCLSSMAPPQDRHLTTKFTNRPGTTITFTICLPASSRRHFLVGPRGLPPAAPVSRRRAP